MCLNGSDRRMVSYRVTIFLVPIVAAHWVRKKERQLTDTSWVFILLKGDDFDFTDDDDSVFVFFMGSSEHFIGGHRANTRFH